MATSTGIKLIEFNKFKNGNKFFKLKTCSFSLKSACHHLFSFLNLSYFRRSVDVRHRRKSFYIKINFF